MKGKCDHTITHKRDEASKRGKKEITERSDL